MSGLIGKPVPRKEGREKVTGAARYVDDLRREGMLHGVTVRSPAARGRIRAIRFGDGIPWDEIVVVTAADIPGKNLIHLIIDDQPALAAGTVEHPEEPVVLLAHADRALLERARRAVTIEVELPDRATGARQVDVEALYDVERCRPRYAGKLGSPMLLSR